MIIAIIVSIAFMIKGVIRIGVVHAPLLNETFTARIGHGAYLNDKKVSFVAHITSIDALDQWLMANGCMWCDRYPYQQLIVWMVLPSRVNLGNIYHFNVMPMRARGHIDEMMMIVYDVIMV
jgi:hypothetical protein